MKPFALVLLFALFPGCIQLGMLGGDHGDSSQQTVLEKETVGVSLKAAALIPPLTKGDESRVTVKLTDRKTGKPVPKAQISVRVEFIHDGKQENQERSGLMMTGSESQNPESIYLHQGRRGMMMQHQMDSTPAHVMQTNHDINMEIPANESSEIGTYNASFTPSQSGSHKIIVTVASVEGYTLENPLVIEGTREVLPIKSGHGGMMGGMGDSTSTWLIIGTAIMIGILLILALRR